MTITVHVYEDAKKFPRLRVEPMPVREKGELPSVRLENYALERVQDMKAAFDLHARLTESYEQGNAHRSPVSFRGLFRLAFATDEELKNLLKDGKSL